MQLMLAHNQDYQESLLGFWRSLHLSDGCHPRCCSELTRGNDSPLKSLPCLDYKVSFNDQLVQERARPNPDSPDRVLHFLECLKL